MTTTKQRMRLLRQRESEDSRPVFSWLCWAQVRRHLGSVFPAYTNCQRSGTIKTSDCRQYCKQHARQRGLTPEVSP